MIPIMKRAIRSVLLAAAALALAACASLTQLAYSNAALAYTNLPPMIAWAVDDWVEMSGDQKEWVRGRIDRLMHWHRTHELPEYRRFFEKVLAESAEPFTVAEVGDAYEDLRRAYRRAMEQALPDIAEFLSRVDSVQAAQMEKKFAEDTRKMVRESTRGTPEQRFERRVKRFVQHLEGWLGDVSDAQREIVEAHYRGLPQYFEERLAERRVRHTETMALIRAKAGKEQMLAGLRRLMLESDTWRRPEYREKLAQRERRMFEMVAALSASLDAGQRAHLQKRIRGYVRDIRTLTVEGRATPSS